MAQRYPISIRLIGVMHKEKSKMYITSVLWSDQNEIVVYRSFEDFKKVNKQMKKAYAPANPLKRSNRIIPKFPDNKMGARRKGPSKSVVRLKSLEKYCNDLLSCDPSVTQSPDIINFFHPKDQDLQPEFAKNSIMIMPSDEATGVNTGHERQVSVGTVTQPFVTETYRCVAPYETKDTKNKPFKVALDEKVDVLIKDKAGWWLVENEDKHLAWFPAPYLEKLDDEDDDDEDDTDGSTGTRTHYTVLKNYKATNGDEVSVDIGSVVEVLQKSDNGWWLIRNKEKAGYVPAMYLQSYNDPRVKITAFQKDLLSSSLNMSQFQTPDPTLTSSQHSHSQGNLLQLPSVCSPNQLQPTDKQKSHSLNILPGTTRPGDNPSRPTSLVISPTTPTIMVEADGEEDQRWLRRTAGGGGSFESDSSDELSCSSGGSSFNLRPDNGRRGKIQFSISDPSIFHDSSMPKVPPRPQAEEILTRCTTVTRKNVAKGGLSPVKAEIVSR